MINHMNRDTRESGDPMDLMRLMTLPAIQLGSLLAEGWQAYHKDSPWADVPALEPSIRILGEAALDCLERGFKVD